MTAHRFRAGAALAVSSALVNLCLAALTPQEASLPYVGDATHLGRWENKSFSNFPSNFWTSGVSLPCSTDDTLPYQGVSCGLERNGQLYVTKLDLSYDHLPKGTPRLRTGRGGLSYEIIGVRYLSHINLDGNLIGGVIPPLLYMAPSLKELILSNNRIVGTLSDRLCSLQLTCLSVANNSMKGPIPQCLQSFPCVDFQGSGLTYTPGLHCNNATNVSSCALPESIHYKEALEIATGISILAVVGIVIGGLLVVALLAALFVLAHKRAEKRLREEERKRLSENIELQVSTKNFGTLRRFSVEELSGAANGFDEDNLLGEGGFSRVYKGTMADGKVVAIKKIKEERKDGELEFLNEVEIISRAVHKHLVHCEGFCVEAGQCMLVLPFYPNGSVAARTVGKQGDPLSWSTRMRIATGAAEGITYLHADCCPKLIHRDIKADNVLLDENDDAVIADFGLAKELDVKETHRTTAVKGTIGHIAPEYFVSGQCSEKTDVYSFGVFLLELISGKDVYTLTAQMEESGLLLRDMVAGLVLNHEIEALLDPDLLSGEEIELSEVLKLVQVSLLCMQPDPNDRPTMEQVTKMLVGEGLVKRWAQFQVHMGQVTKEEVMKLVNDPAIWNSTTTGVDISAFAMQSPR